jgi:hypothetical protein
MCALALTCGACSGAPPSELIDPNGASTFGTDPPAGEGAACSKGSDCASGALCCGSFDTTKGYVLVDCRASCDEGNPAGTTGVQLCDPHANECPTRTACAKSASLHGEYWCAPAP